MSKESKDWLEQMARLDYIRPEDIPNIELYMDQMTTFMEQQLSYTKRTPEEKIMTKTMINNYTKNKLLPPPEKKKYTKDHMILLIFIYYFKSIMSIADIKEVLTPLTEHCLGKEKDFEDKVGLFEVYQKMFQMMNEHYHPMKEELERLKEKAEKTFQIEGEKGEFLNKLSYMMLLCYDIYIRKQMIESMIDEMGEDK